MKRLFWSIHMAISQQGGAVDSAIGGVRDRLLDSAEQLFAERGFDGTSIRDLASAAKCNIASVNYYFGGKEKLYVEIWRRHLHLMMEARIASIDKVLSESEGRPARSPTHSSAHSLTKAAVPDSSG
jgi:AcrR family transcriptional regulator